MSNTEQEDKRFVKKLVTKLTLFGVGAHLIYKFYEMSGLGNQIREILRFQPNTYTTSRPDPDTLTGGSGGGGGGSGGGGEEKDPFLQSNDPVIVELDFGSGRILKLTKEGEYDPSVFEQEGLFWENDQLDRVEVKSTTHQVHLRENWLNVNSDRGNAEFVVWSEDGKVELGKQSDFDYPNKISSLIIKPKSSFRVHLWKHDDKDEDGWWGCSTLTEYGQYNLNDLKNYGFQNDELTIVRIDGNADCILAENDNLEGHRVLVNGGSEVNLKDWRMGGEWPNDRVSSLEIVPKDKYGAFVTFYDNDPVKTGQRSVSYAISQEDYNNSKVFNIPSSLNDRITWVCIHKGSHIQCWEHANAGGVSWEKRNEHNRVGWAHFHNLKSGGGGMNDRVSSFRMINI
jgi:endonuclease I